MADDIILPVKIDLTSAEQQLTQFKQTFENLKETIEQAPNATNVFNQGLERAIDTADMLLKKVEKAQGKVGADEDNVFVQDIRAGLGELSTLKDLFSDGGAFSTSLARNMFGGLSDAVKQELDANTSAIAAMIRTKIGTLKSTTLAGLSREIMNSIDAQEIFKNFKATESDVYKSFIQSMIPHVAPDYSLSDYRGRRHGTDRAASTMPSPVAAIPAGFRASYQNGKYTGSQTLHEGYMQQNQRDIIRNIVQNNDAAMRAAVATSGMIRYDNAGRASLAYNITPQMYEKFRENLFNDFIKRSSGKESERIDPFSKSLSQDEERRLFSRMTSSSAGRALSAMKSLEAISGEDIWGTESSGGRRGYQRLKAIPKPTLEQYEVAKYGLGSLFGGSDKHDVVTINESQNTRRLGLQGHHNDFTDKVVLVSANGYDKNNVEQQQFVEKLLSGQAINIPGTGKKYIAQNIHGTGNHAVIRMIEEEAYNAVKAQNQEWAKQNGFVDQNGNGLNIWNDFIPENFDYKDIKSLRKHYDATGKGWTPGSHLESNFAGKKFGVVDLSKVVGEAKQKLADGLAWFADGVLPYDDIQSRMGVAGKGTSHTVKGYKTMGEWAKAVGLLNKDGRFILPGPRGDVDVTDFAGFADLSTVKNEQAYANFKTAEEYNKAYTAQLQRYGITALQDYESAETRGRGLGAQAMAYMNLSPQMQQQQVKEFNRRMRLLDTEAGVREYLLGDPDNVVGQMVREGTLSVGSSLVKSWVESERASLMDRIASGEWIDFGEQPSVVNQKANKMLVTSLLGLRDGASQKEILDHVRSQYKAKTGKDLQYTDEELTGAFALNKGQIVDFARPEEREVSVQRSPTGFGNFVYGKNYAYVANDLDKALHLGINKSGVFLSEADMATLGGADFDGDAVKTLYGDIGAAVKEAAIIHERLQQVVGYVPDPKTTPVKLEGIDDFKSSPKHMRLAFEANVEAPLHMGSSEGAGIRATMVDLGNPMNRDYLISAIQANPAYNDTSAGAKNATETEVTKQMRNVISQGAQWSRLPSKYSRLFNVVGNDDVDKPDDADIFTASNGIKINLNELRALDIDRINARSIHSAADIAGARASAELAKGGVDLSRVFAVLEALDQGVGYGDAGEKTKALMKTMRSMKLFDLVGSNKLLGEEDLSKLDEMITAARFETGGKKADLNKYGITSANNFMSRGIHMRNIDMYGRVRAEEEMPELFGNTASNFEIAGDESVRALLAYRRGTEQQNEELANIDREIEDRQKKVDSIKEKIPSENKSSTVPTVNINSPVEEVVSAEEANIAREEKRIEELKERKEEIERERSSSNMYDYIKAQEEFSRFQESIDMFEGGLYSNIARRKAYLDETPEADSYFRQKIRTAERTYLNAENIRESDAYKNNRLLPVEKDRIDRALSPSEGVYATVFKDFGATAAAKAKQLYERFEKTNNKNGGAQEALNEEFEQYDKSLKTVIGYRDRIAKELLDHDLNDSVKEQLEKDLDQTNEYVDKAKEQINKRKEARQYKVDEQYRRREAQTELSGMQQAMQAERYDSQVDQQIRQWNMRGAHDIFSRNLLQRYSTYEQFRNQSNNLQYQIAVAEERQRQAESVMNDKNADEKDIANAQVAYAKAAESLTHYYNALDNTKEAMKQFENSDGEFSESMNTTKATIEGLSQSAERLLSQFGRRMFQKAFQEAKSFVVQFDSQMRNIQAITMKTDEEMETLRKNTIDTAIELKTTVANVAQVEADLYRQGLNDQQVEERSSAIIKFATVTGAKVTDAGKAITTAIQNDLVNSAEEAMDVLTALGDNAATTANEIFKGMQKSAAAAKVAGVSYDELTTLLTIGTSKTQLSGQVIGTGLQTIFSRMNRVTNQGYYNDETGATTTVNDVEKALKSAGISLRNEDGKSFRNSFDVLRDLSKVWSSLNDLQRSNITYTMAGGRQMNVFASLMEGMSEDGGLELERLLGLAQESEGTTESKYEIAAKSITAALNELQSTFDSVVDTVSSSNFFVGTVQGITDILGGFKNFTENSGGFAAAIAVVAAAIGALAVKMVVLNAAKNTAFGGVAGLISSLAAIGVVAGVAAAAGGIGNAQESSKPETDDQKIKTANEFYTAQKKRTSSVQDQIDKVNELGEAWENSGSKMNTTEATSLGTALDALTTTLNTLGISFNENGTAIENWRSIANGAQDAVHALNEEAAKYNDEMTDKKLIKDLDSLFDKRQEAQQFKANKGYSYSSMAALADAGMPIAARVWANSNNLISGADVSLEDEAAQKAFAAYALKEIISGNYEIYKDEETADQWEKLQEAYKDYEGTTAFSLWASKNHYNKSSIDLDDMTGEMFASLTESFVNYYQNGGADLTSKAQFTSIESEQKEAIKNAILNSSQLDYIFGGNQEYISALADQAVEALGGKEYASSSDLYRAIADYRTGLVNKYSGKSKEWLNKTMNPDDYDYQIEYVDPNTRKKVKFGSKSVTSEEDAYQQALQYMEEAKGDEQVSETQALTNATTGATASMDNLSTALSQLPGQIAQALVDFVNGKKQEEAGAGEGGGTVNSDLFAQFVSWITGGSTQGTEITGNGFNVKGAKIRGTSAGATASDVPITRPSGPQPVSKELIDKYGLTQDQVDALNGMSVQERLSFLQTITPKKPTFSDQIDMRIATEKAIEEQNEAWKYSAKIGAAPEGGEPLNLELLHQANNRTYDTTAALKAIQDRFGITSLKDFQSEYHNRATFGSAANAREFLTSIATMLGYDESYWRESGKDLSYANVLALVTDAFAQKQSADTTGGKFVAGYSYEPIYDALEDLHDYSGVKRAFVDSSFGYSINKERKDIKEDMSGSVASVITRLLSGGASLEQITKEAKEAEDVAIEIEELVAEGADNILGGEAFDNASDTVKTVMASSYFVRKKQEEEEASALAEREAAKKAALAKKLADDEAENARKRKELEDIEALKTKEAEARAAEEEAKNVAPAATPAPTEPHKPTVTQAYLDELWAEYNQKALLTQANEAVANGDEKAMLGLFARVGPEFKIKSAMSNKTFSAMDLIKYYSAKINSEVGKQIVAKGFGEAQSKELEQTIDSYIGTDTIFDHIENTIEDEVVNKVDAIKASDVFNDIVDKAKTGPGVLGSIVEEATNTVSSFIGDAVKNNAEQASGINLFPFVGEVTPTPKKAKQNNGLRMEDVVFTSKPISSLSNVLEQAESNAKKNDLTEQYEDLLSYAQKVGSFSALEELLTTGNVDAALFASVINSDEQLRKIMSDQKSGKGKYSYNDFLEQLRQGAISTTFSTLVPQISSNAYNYNKQRAALTAVQNGTATDEQYELVANQYGIDRHTLVNNLGTYTSLEGTRLDIERTNMQNSAATVIGGMMSSYIEGLSKEDMEKMFASDNAFTAMWGDYVMQQDNKEALIQLMSDYIAAGYEFSVNEAGKVSAKHNGQPVHTEDILNPDEWNRSVSKAQTRQDVLAYLDNGTTPTDEKRKQALASYSSEMQEYINLTDEARDSAEGLMLLDKIKIQVAIDGLEDLAYFGQMSEEAVTWATQLAKGGTHTAEALKSIRSTTYNTAQLAGALNAETRTEAMNQTIMDYLGISSEQFYKDEAKYIQELQQEFSSDAFRISKQNDYSEALKNAPTDVERNRIISEIEGLGGVVYGNNGVFLGEDWYKNATYTTGNQFKANGRTFNAPSAVRGALRDILDFGYDADAIKENYEGMMADIESYAPLLAEMLNTTDEARKKEIEIEIRTKISSDELNDIIKYGQELQNIADIVSGLENIGTMTQLKGEAAQREDVYNTMFEAFAMQQMQKVANGELAFNQLSSNVQSYVKQQLGYSGYDVANLPVDSTIASEYLSQDRINILNNQRLKELNYLFSKGASRDQIEAYGGYLTFDENGNAAGVGLQSNWYDYVNYQQQNFLKDYAYKYSDQYVEDTMNKILNGSLTEVYDEALYQQLSNMFGADNITTMLNEGAFQQDRDTARQAIEKTIQLRDFKNKETTGVLGSGMSDIAERILFGNDEQVQAAEQEALSQIETLKGLSGLLYAFNNDQLTGDEAGLQQLFDLTGATALDNFDADKATEVLSRRINQMITLAGMLDSAGISDALGDMTSAEVFLGENIQRLDNLEAWQKYGLSTFYGSKDVAGFANNLMSYISSGASEQAQKYMQENAGLYTAAKGKYGDIYTELSSIKESGNEDEYQAKLAEYQKKVVADYFSNDILFGRALSETSDWMNQLLDVNPETREKGEQAMKAWMDEHNRRSTLATATIEDLRKDSEMMNDFISNTTATSDADVYADFDKYHKEMVEKVARENEQISTTANILSWLGDSEFVSTWLAGNTGKGIWNKTSPLDTHKVGLSTASTLKYVSDLVNAGESADAVFRGLDDDVQNQLQSFPSLLDYIKTYGDGTEEAAEAARNLGKAIRSETIGALEEKGKVLSGLSSQIETIVTGNAMDSIKQVNALKSSLVEMADAYEAYQNIAKGGKTKQSDWNLIQAITGMSDTDLQKYQNNPSAFIKDYKNIFADINDLQAQSSKTAAENIIKGKLGVQGGTVTEAIKPKNFLEAIQQTFGFKSKQQTREKTLDEMIAEASPEDIDKYNQWISGTGMMINKEGKLVPTTEGLATGELKLSEAAANARNARNNIIGNGDAAKDYKLMLTYAGLMRNGGTFNGFETLLNVAQASGRLTTDAAQTLLTSDEYMRMYENKDIDGLINMLIGNAYGISTESNVRFGNKTVQEYLNAAVNGNKGTLSGFENLDEDIKNYLKGIDGFESVMSTILAGGKVEDWQTKLLKGSMAYQNLYEQERNGTYRTGTAELAKTIAEGTTSEQKEAISGQVEEIKQLQNASDIIDYIVANQGENNSLLWDELKDRANLNDDEVEYYKKHTDELGELQDELDGKLGDISEALKAAIVSAFDLGSFDDIALDSNKGLRSLIEKVLNVNGFKLNIDEEGGATIEAQELTPLDVLNNAIGKGTYSSSYQTDQYRLQIANMMREAGGIDAFKALYEQAGELEGNEWMKNESIVNKVFGTDFANFLQQAEAGNFTGSELVNAFIQSTGYGALNHDISFYNNMSKARDQFGQGFGVSDTLSLNTEQLASVKEFIASDGDFAKWIQSMDGGADFLYELGAATNEFTYDMKQLNGEMSAKKVEQFNRFGKTSSEVASGVRSLSGDIKNSNEYMKTFRQNMNAIQNNQYYRQKYKGGDRSKNTLENLAQMTGFDKKQLEQGGSLIENALESAESADKKAVDNYLNTVGTMIADGLQGTVQDQLQQIGLNAADIGVVVEGGSVQVDLSQLAAQATGAAQQQIQELIATISSMGMEAQGVVSSDGNSIKLTFNTTDLGSGRKSGGGGGGGGGKKSEAQKLLEKIKREKALVDHEIKMIRYQETKYENASEIGNQNRMIELENTAQKKLIKTMEQAIEKTKKQMKSVKKNSDDWKNLYDSVLSYEEAIEEANQAIADNTKKIQENEQAILKLHTDLEDTINAEIEARKQRERDMLSGTVSMEDIILEAIRQRYRDEWALVEKDIEKKKQALEEEKNLIDERLQRRKDAEDEAEKYEELSEYKKQLALIEMDSTRTKDAAKLREQIAKLEKDISWDIAEDEANYQKEQIEDQIQAYDDFLNYGSEDLEDYLEDANNFADEVNGVLQMTQENMMQWLKDNVKDYALAMDDAQKQMVQGWEDTYDQMLGITHTYWDEISAILSGKNVFLRYMTASQDYINASEDEQAQMLYNWGEMYDNWLAAQKRDAVYSHNDNWANGIGKSSSSGGGGGSNNNKTYDTDLASYIDNIVKDLNSVNSTTTTDNSNTSARVGTVNVEKAVVLPETSVAKTTYTGLDLFKAASGVSKYASGGVVDYTGIAWVDGTPMKPESFLDAEDTALMRDMLESAKYVRYRSTISNIDSSAFNGNAQNIGELIINITEAQFKDDADFDEVAQRVGDKFVKELAKQGFHTLSYAF